MTLHHPLPRTGDRVEIEVARKGADADVEHFHAAVHDKTDEGIIIGVPEAGGETAALRPRDRILVKYHVGEAGYEFETFVLGGQTRPFPLLYVLSPAPEGIAKRQLRQYVRVDTNLPCQVARQDDPAGEAFAGMITNISGGGIKVSALVEFKVGDVLRFRFEVPEENATIDGAVGEVIMIRPGAEKATDYVVQFKGIDERSRDIISKYVLDIQIKMRRRQKMAARKRGEEAS
jgi:c-di-GMP-binding flagellar brake protein YcgR